MLKIFKPWKEKTINILFFISIISTFILTIIHDFLHQEHNLIKDTLALIALITIFILLFQAWVYDFHRKGLLVAPYVTGVYVIIEKLGIKYLANIGSQYYLLVFCCIDFISCGLLYILLIKIVPKADEN